MNQFFVAGSIDSALTHFAALGLASILDEDLDGHVTTWWQDGAQARAVVASPFDDEAIGELVRTHGRRHLQPESWVQARIKAGSRAGSGLFTARVKAPSLSEWPSYAAERAAARPSAVVTVLDEQMQLALGEPAWWRCDEKETRPDDGSSRWEMKTRNQGQEFIVHRLAPLAAALAARSTDAIIDGLRGVRVRDETGKDSATSRTGTGLTQPGPVDTAVAWCALWGLHVAPTVQQPGGLGQSPGVWPRNIVHPREAALPVYSRCTTPRAYSDLLRSRQFDRACDWEQKQRPDVVAAREWLTEHGVRALLRIPIARGGSQSAPERQLLTGRVETL